ncbi:bifunctional folylpolyglutamate synthase/dihydrofolate synthase [Odoribacter sp. OttesenSCG-928-L07]|nr:bifunctional folylpolyglutamate synthase/dihydrofolate synthase [Odoribacter sp. OttesenSCG-928-L07]MDL2238702.1 bifunctional folylpolyglutamate synthase/dihydrofolate synthase [Bacteroidales bacterium OttesenSCG-928-L14]
MNNDRLNREYQECIEFLFSRLPMYQRIGKAAYKADLNNIISLCNYLGNPQDNLKFIHVAGTNGKTSVSHYLASIFEKAGYKTGLYTSPHLIDFRERILVNSKMIDKKYVCDFVEKHKDFILDCQPSFFEITVAMAFQYFKDENINCAIIEVGLGGRLDSTNIINPELSVITNIGFDHTEFLGNDLKSIAGEKAGIIKENTPIIISETQDDIKDVFIDKAKNLNATIFFADKIIEVSNIEHSIDNLQLQCFSSFSNNHYNLSSNLAGLYEVKNIRAVVLAIEILRGRFNISDEALIAGLHSTVLRGRWEKLGNDPLVICDTGHNVDGIKEVVNCLTSLEYNKLHIVIGAVGDKDLDNIIQLLPKDATYYFCKPSIPRGMDVEVLKSKFETVKITGESFPSCYDAYLAAKENADKNDVIFIGGSTFVVADVLEKI